MADGRGGVSGSLSSTGPGSFNVQLADIALRRGTAPLEPTTVPTLPAGQSFTIDIPTQGIGLLLPAVQKVRDAAARQTALDLELRSGALAPPSMSGKVSKVEAITIKQSVSRGAFSWEITLRKL